MHELVVKEKENIKDKIYMIRGKQVMLDSDLAKLYEVETKQLNRQVKRNIERFDDDFMFQLTEEEYISLRCQIGTSNEKRGGRRTIPYVFTELGVSTAASVLHSDIAIKMSKEIMRAFVAMRHYIMDNDDVYKSITNINNKLIEHDNKLDYIFSKFSLNGKLLEINNDNKIYIKSIFEETNSELIIIDPYLDDSIYELIKDLKTNIILITNNKKKLTINKKNIKIIYNNTFHDRYIIIDKDKCYLIGTSFNNLNSKTSTVIKIEDIFIKNDLFSLINDLLKL